MVWAGMRRQRTTATSSRGGCFLTWHLQQGRQTSGRVLLRGCCLPLFRPPHDPQVFGGRHRGSAGMSVLRDANAQHT